MQLRLIDPDLIRVLAESGGNAEKDQPEFVFDDEPLDRILYGIGEQGPTPAGFYGAERRYMREARTALRQGNAEAAINACAALASCDCQISIGMCGELASLLRAIVPQVPNPRLPVDLGPLRPLLEKIWIIAGEKRDVVLQKQIGSPLFRWYEHHGIYEEARRILNTLVEINAFLGDVSEEAVARNNLAFEYMLEGRFGEAIAGFDEAARLFEQTGDRSQRANSRANYWTCRFARGEAENLDQIEAELQELAESLGLSGFWQTRKPLVLLAQIAERRGKIGEAVELVKKAIQSAAGSGTRYPDMDAEYLGRLQAKIARA